MSVDSRAICRGYGGESHGHRASTVVDVDAPPATWIDIEVVCMCIREAIAGSSYIPLMIRPTNLLQSEVHRGAPTLQVCGIDRCVDISGNVFDVDVVLNLDLRGPDVFTSTLHLQSSFIEQIEVLVLIALRRVFQILDLIRLVAVINGVVHI
jgi:hypothetical protein